VGVCVTDFVFLVMLLFPLRGPVLFPAGVFVLFPWIVKNQGRGSFTGHSSLPGSICSCNPRVRSHSESFLVQAGPPRFDWSGPPDSPCRLLVTPTRAIGELEFWGFLPLVPWKRTSVLSLRLSSFFDVSFFGWGVPSISTLFGSGIPTVDFCLSSP